MPVVIHSAPLVLPMSAEHLRDGAVAVRGERVLAVGPRTEMRLSFPAAEERHWRGMLVAGLVDACSAVTTGSPG
ncbi:hypothetical protein ACFQYP_05325 [Nonomuraea antimicrobica]